MYRYDCVAERIEELKVEAAGLWACDDVEGAVRVEQEIADLSHSHLTNIFEEE